ncbi:MAG: hypothetical protein ING69_13740 [Rhodocyclaceae bacterium]|nr:hypothetical protein [Rhodocyclaceae bacterium]MCA3083706.1 hypothetical protein [Rhodocyclaceae bacterium]
MSTKVSMQEMTKITVVRYPKIWNAFSARLDGAFIRRDAFLDQMISREIRHAKEDLSGRVQSQAAARHIKKSLKSLIEKRGGGISPRISINLQKSTAADLNAMCAQHNMNRDAFLNRLVWLLLAPDSLLKRMGLSSSTDNLRYPQFPVGPIAALEELQLDPLFYMRHECFEENGCGLYSFPLGQKLDGQEIAPFACYLPDEDVPRTKAYRKKKLQQDAMIELISIGDEPTPAAGKIKKRSKK